jgi:GntR family transcriptional regulator
LNTLTGRIRLDFRSDEPITAQIVRQVEMLVADGVLKAGDQLPTVREVAIDLRINFSTVARAYRILDEKRLISTQRGRGTYIWDEGVQQANPGQPRDESQGGESALARQDEPIDTLARNYIEQALQLGYAPAEIEQAVARRVSK